MEEKWLIDKLGSSNWITWKFQIRHLLMAKGLWKYVDGSEVLAEDASEATRTKFRDESQKAISTIIMTISTPQLYLVTSCEKPKDVWDTLKKHFERETLANKLYLKKQYFRKELKESTPMEVHLKEMKEITDKLSSIGAPISEEDQVVTLLGSLPPSYSTLVTALEARVDDIQLDFVQQALINEELKRKGQDDCSSPPNQRDAALVGASRPRTPPTCWKCGEVGHIQRYCPKDKNSSTQHRAKAAAEEKPNESANGEGAFVVPENLPEMDRWLIDSGASSHMTPQREYLVNYRKFDTPEKVGLGDGRIVEAEGIGNVHLNMLFKVSDSKRAVMYDVLYVPKMACNLFSVRAATRKGNTIKFGRSKCWIRDRSGKLYGVGSLADRLYELDCELNSTEYASAACEQRNEMDLWHQRLGHLNGQQLNDIAQKQLATGITLPNTMRLSFCEGCVEGKMHRTPFKSVGGCHSRRKLYLVHSDVCGPMQTDSIGGRKYFVTFIDDFTRCCAVYFLKQKSEVLDKFKEFEAIVTNECGESVATLRTDNGGEYLSREFQEFLKSKGIKHELTIPRTPEQNGVAERVNRTLIESARAMIYHAGLPNTYWAEAVATAAYLKNRSTTSALKGHTTPYEQWYGRKPDLSHLRVFGCMAYAHIPDSERRKLDKKAEKLRFVGYCKNSKGYRLLDETTQTIKKRRDVIFNETVFDFDKAETKQSVVDVCPEIEEKPPADESQTDTPQPQLQPQDPRRSGRQKSQPVRYGFNEYADTAKVDHVACNACQITEPNTIEEALTNGHSTEWKAATDSEFESLMENKTWEHVELPKDREAYSVSTPADASVELVKDDGFSKDVDSVKYQSMVGSLLYAAMATRPDVAHAVGAVSKFNSKPSEAHLTAVKRILRYPKGTANLALKYQKSEKGSLCPRSSTKWCPTSEMLADLLAKSLSKRRFETLWSAMGMDMFSV